MLTKRAGHERSGKEICATCNSNRKHISSLAVNTVVVRPEHQELAGYWSCD